MREAQSLYSLNLQVRYFLGSTHLNLIFEFYAKSSHVCGFPTNVARNLS